MRVLSNYHAPFHQVQSMLFAMMLLSLCLTAQDQFPDVGAEANQTELVFDAGTHSAIQQTPLLTQAGKQPATQKWKFHLAPRVIHEHESTELDSIKGYKTQLKRQTLANGQSSISKKQSASNPIIGTNFEGNWSVLAHPPDNNIAISNGGEIVSVNNDGVEYYDESGNLLFVEDWSDFINDNSLTSIIYDPVIAYDSGADRFVMAVLHGTNSATSQVLVLFSQSNDPMAGWYVYKLTGDPLNLSLWFDYPKIGVSGQEIYITGNLFNNNENFNQSIIYQIEKSQGYAGGSLNWQYWHNLNTQPFPAFTLVPTSYGHQGNVGPGMLFVSSRPGGENRVRLWQITDYLGNNPSLNSFVANVTPYSPPGDAFMPNTNLTLNNQDCRIFHAFFLNNTVHYALHSDIGQGWNGIHYNRLNINNLQNQSATLGKPGSEDYSFPVLASFATQTGDPSVMISFLHSSTQIYPSTSVVHCGPSMQWSQPVLIKAGENYVDFLQGNRQRWGDYNGMARKHSSSQPEVWSATSYGADIVTANASLPNTYKTWIAKIQGNAVGSEEMLSSRREVSVYPNPLSERLSIDFTLEQREEIRIEIRDIQNKLVKLLYRDVPRSLENRMSFSPDALPPGHYFVVISTNNKILHNEKLLVD